ncbi:MAG: hypothetical protein ABSD32_12720 [Mycobacterium sp.]|jgi:hypothetical protein
MKSPWLTRFSGLRSAPLAAMTARYVTGVVLPIHGGTVAGKVTGSDGDFK